jgi:uncharacterized protein
MNIRLHAIVAIAFCMLVPAAWASDTVNFFRAVDRDDARTVARLLERGVDPNARDERGHVALVLAMQVGSPTAAEALLRHPRLDVEQANSAGETALMMAALHGREDWVRRLIEQGAQVNRSGWTPLHYAASGPATGLVALLLDRGAEIEAASPNGTTPLMMAAGYGSEDAATLLLQRGADLSRRNDRGLDAIDFAQRAGRDALVRRLQAARR